jgi:2-dehydropantoate 2-reductase
MNLKYAVIGTGAIGGYYGGMLAKAGNEVHFLFHSDYEYVKANGLQVNSVNGNFNINPVNAYNSVEDMPKCDIILVCLKTTNNDLLKSLLPPLIHKRTLVVLIQNGLGVEADLQKEFPDLMIAGAMAFICSNKTNPGIIEHLDYGKLTIGSYSCSDNALLEQLSNDFVAAGVEAELVDLGTARWKKLVWNIPFNGMTVVLNTTTDRLMNNEDTARLSYHIMLEVIGAANHLGYKIEEAFAEAMMDMTRTMTPYAPSMKLDYDFRRSLEIYYIYTRPVEEASKSGYEMKYVSMLEKQLKFIESQYINR